MTVTPLQTSSPGQWLSGAFVFLAAREYKVAGITFDLYPHDVRPTDAAFLLLRLRLRAKRAVESYFATATRHVGASLPVRFRTE